MSENPYIGFDLPALESLRDRYVARGDGARAAQVREAITATGATQTQELVNCGRLFAHDSARDNAGRVTTSWTGDNGAWMRFFMTQGAVGKIDVALAQQAARKQGGGGA